MEYILIGLLGIPAAAVVVWLLTTTFVPPDQRLFFGLFLGIPAVLLTELSYFLWIQIFYEIITYGAGCAVVGSLAAIFFYAICGATHSSDNEDFDFNSDSGESKRTVCFFMIMAMIGKFFNMA